MEINQGSMESRRLQSCSYQSEISAQKKQSKQEHCYGGETNLQHTIYSGIFNTHLPVNGREHL
jgi:hypothetical protein